jgi:hypothetical protein
MTLELDRRAGVPVVLMLALWAAPHACAQVARTSGGEWQFEAAPYIWAASTHLSADVGLRIPAADLAGAAGGGMSSSRHAGAMGSFEARKNRWGILLDFWHLKVVHASKPVLDGVLGNASLKTTRGVVQLAGAYRVWNHETTPVDAIAGIRYSYLKADIDLSPSPFVRSGANFSDSVDWPDAYGGIRVAHALSEKWALVGYADIGAGATKKSWQVLAGADYAFSKNMSAKFGYRVFNMNYEKTRSIPEAGAKADFRIDMRTAGIYGGLGIKF